MVQELQQSGASSFGFRFRATRESAADADADAAGNGARRRRNGNDGTPFLLSSSTSYDERCGSSVAATSSVSNGLENNIWWKDA